MSAYNVVENVGTICPRCGAGVSIGVQFKFGSMWQYHYAIGDTVLWGGNDEGAPGMTRVVADGAADCPCPACAFTQDWDFYVFLERDRIVGVRPADGSHDFVRVGNTYLDLSSGPSTTRSW